MASLELIIKPLKFLEAIKRLGKKKPIAKKLSSKQWAAMPTHIRERAYFTANVESMKFLNRSKKMLNDYLSGARETVTTPDGRRVTALKKASRADFVYEMQKLAKETGLGNVLPPGKDMSRDMITRMKDIASESRLNLIFDTQTQQAQAYGYYKQGQDPAILDAFPAQRFIRAEQRKEPRPLHERNKDKVKRKDDMDFWLRMNDQSIGGLGVPFGPWGFNSGMDVEDVRRDEAEKLGLIEKNEQVLPPDDTFNKGLKAAADVDPEFLEKFMDKMGDEAINYGETVELSQRMSDVPPPAPAKKVSIKKMGIDLPKPKEPKDFKLPEPNANIQKNLLSLRDKDVRRLTNDLNRHLPKLKKHGQFYSGPSWVKPYAKVFKEKYNKNQKITLKDIKDKVTRETKKWVGETNSFIRVKKGTLTKILKDERFKSQFETQTSGGFMDNSHRAQFEANVFSYPASMDPTKRPIYGYATEDKKGHYLRGDFQVERKENHFLDQYGRIRVKLKRKTKQRTTVTFGDSLGGIGYGSDGSLKVSYIPTPLDDPTHESQPIRQENVLPFLEGRIGGGRYVETQVHGGVNLDDIEEVYFPDQLWVNPARFEKLKKLLKEKGIKWTMD